MTIIVLNYLSLPPKAGVLFTMFYMFIKSSETGSKRQKKKIAREYMLVFLKNQDLVNLNQQRLELYLNQISRERQARKERVYREMADKQIQDIFAKMMGLIDLRFSFWTILIGHATFVWWSSTTMSSPVSAALATA